MANAYKFAVFISYSSKDRKFARRLHRWLEQYRIPAQLGHHDITGSGRRNRIYPVFRDREELSAGILSERIEDALRSSANLVVVCSPHAAASPWVEREIQNFASMGKPGNIFAIIAPDAPLADRDGTDLTINSFPPSFRANALAGHEGIEPLAADARRGKDGVRKACLKIVAGLIGVNAGSLEDRDRRRRGGRRRALFASVLSTLVIAVAAFVVQARIRHVQANRVLFSAVEKELAAIASPTLEDAGSSSRAVRLSVLADKENFLFPKSPLADGMLIRSLNVLDVAYSSDGIFDTRNPAVFREFPDLQGRTVWAYPVAEAYDPGSAAMFSLMRLYDEDTETDSEEKLVLSRFAIDNQSTDLAALKADCNDIYVQDNIVLSCRDDAGAFFLFADKQSLQEVGRVRNQGVPVPDKTVLRYLAGLGGGADGVNTAEERMASFANSPRINRPDRGILYSSAIRGSADSLAHNLTAWVGEYGEMNVWDPRDGRTILQTDRNIPALPCCIQFSDSGRELLVDIGDYILEVPFDPNTYTFLDPQGLSWEERQKEFGWKLVNTGLSDDISAFKLSPDGDRLIAATKEGTAVLMERDYYETWTAAKSYDAREFGPVAAIVPDWSTQIFAFQGYSGAFWISRDVDGSRPAAVDMELLGPFFQKHAPLVAYLRSQQTEDDRRKAQALLQQIADAHSERWGERVEGITVAQSGEMFASIGDNHVGIWTDTVELIQDKDLSDHRHPRSVNFSPDGRRLVMILGKGGILSQEIGSEHTSCNTDFRANFLGFDSTGTLLVAFDRSSRNWPRLFDPVTCEEISNEDDQDMISKADLNPGYEGGATYFDNGRRMIVYDGTDIVVFDRTTGMVLGSFTVNQTVAAPDSFRPSMIVSDDTLFFVDQLQLAFSLDLRPYLTNESRLSRNLPTFLDEACDPDRGLLRGSQRFITNADIELAPVLEGRAGEDVCVQSEGINQFLSPW